MKTIAFLLLLSSSALARLGETEAESTKRYGAPTTTLAAPTDKTLLEGAKEVTYSYEGWRVRVAFLNGKAARMEYAKLPEGGALKKLSETEVNAILEAEKGQNSFRWKEEKPRTGFEGLNKLQTAVQGRRWERSDHAIAKLLFDLVVVLEGREVEAYEKKLARQSGAQPKATPAIPRF